MAQAQSHASHKPSPPEHVNALSMKELRLKQAATDAVAAKLHLVVLPWDPTTKKEVCCANKTFATGLPVDRMPRGVDDRIAVAEFASNFTDEVSVRRHQTKELGVKDMHTRNWRVQFDNKVAPDYVGFTCKFIQVGPSISSTGKKSKNTSKDGDLLGMWMHVESGAHVVDANGFKLKTPLTLFINYNAKLNLPMALVSNSSKEHISKQTESVEVGEFAEGMKKGALYFVLQLDRTSITHITTRFVWRWTQADVPRRCSEGTRLELVVEYAERATKDKNVACLIQGLHARAFEPTLHCPALLFSSYEPLGEAFKFTVKETQDNMLRGVHTLYPSPTAALKGRIYSHHYYVRDEPGMPVSYDSHNLDLVRERTYEEDPAALAATIAFGCASYAIRTHNWEWYYNMLADPSCYYVSQCHVHDLEIPIKDMLVAHFKVTRGADAYGVSHTDNGEARLASIMMSRHHYTVAPACWKYLKNSDVDALARWQARIKENTDPNKKIVVQKESITPIENDHINLVLAYLREARVASAQIKSWKLVEEVTPQAEILFYLGTVEESTGHSLYIFRKRLAAVLEKPFDNRLQIMARQLTYAIAIQEHLRLPLEKREAIPLAAYDASGACFVMQKEGIRRKMFICDPQLMLMALAPPAPATPKIAPSREAPPESDDLELDSETDEQPPRNVVVPAVNGHAHRPPPRKALFSDSFLAMLQGSLSVAAQDRALKRPSELGFVITTKKVRSAEEESLPLATRIATDQTLEQDVNKLRLAAATTNSRLVISIPLIDEAEIPVAAAAAAAL